MNSLELYLTDRVFQTRTWTLGLGGMERKREKEKERREMCRAFFFLVMGQEVFWDKGYIE